jgi:hypothetical protein
MNTPEKELSESLLAACKAAGVEKPRYIAQDEDGTVWHYDGEPDTTGTSDVGIFSFDPDVGEHAINLDHPPYADDWKDSLLEWVEPQEMLPTVFIPHKGEMRLHGKEAQVSDPYEREAAKAAIQTLEREIARVTEQRDGAFSLIQYAGELLGVTPQEHKSAHGFKVLQAIKDLIKQAKGGSDD